MSHDRRMPVLSHWIDGKPYEGAGDRRGDVYDPATGQISKQVGFAAPVDVDAAVASALSAFGGWRTTSLAKRTQLLFSFREAMNDRRDEIAEIVTSEHGKVRSDALGEVARAGGRRVRLWHRPPRQGRVLRRRLDGSRRLLDPTAAWRRRRDQPLQLPGDGALLVLPDRHRRGEHRRPEAERKGPLGGEHLSASCGQRSASRRGSTTSSTATRWLWTACSSIPTSSRFRSSARRRSPAMSTRPALAPASASRRSGAPRTT